MALTPSAVDPNRRKELDRMNKLLKDPNKASELKQEFNMEANENTKVVVKDTETTPEVNTENRVKSKK